MPPTARAPAPKPVRIAGAVVVVEALAAVAFAVTLGVEAGSGEFGVGSVLAEVGYFVVVALALGAVGLGLLRGRRWARTPAIVTQLLLLPVVYSLIGVSQELALGIVTGVLVAGTFLLLISEPARRWSMDLPEDLPEEGRSSR